MVPANRIWHRTLGIARSARPSWKAAETSNTTVARCRGARSGKTSPDVKSSAALACSDLALFGTAIEEVDRRRQSTGQSKKAVDHDADLARGPRVDQGAQRSLALSRRGSDGTGTGFVDALILVRAPLGEASSAMASSAMASAMASATQVGRKFGNAGSGGVASMVMKLEPNLIFQGQCKAAFELYERVLGGKIVTMLTYADSPMSDEVPSDWGSKIAHATLALGETNLSGADAFSEDSAGPQGFYLLIHPPGQAEAERVFRQLAEGGEVTIPLQETFFSPAYGILTDQFGISWKINTVEPS